MSSIRLRKQGGSIVVTIPASEAKKLDLNTKYIVKTDEYGSISLIPKLDNPFKDAKPGEYYEEDVWADMKPAGKEV